MAKSFYELDYIIEVNEKRLAEYTTIYQKILERYSNIILIYSGLGIFLIPLIQHILIADINNFIFYGAFILFAGLLLLSVIYFIRLLLPIEIAFLHPPKKYYKQFKDILLSIGFKEPRLIDESLKISYIIDLEKAIDSNSIAVRKKNTFFYNALLLALLAITPYMVCMGFHLSKKEKKIENLDTTRKSL